MLAAFLLIIAYFSEWGCSALLAVPSGSSSHALHQLSIRFFFMALFVYSGFVCENI
jgi:hypothetical protein